MVSERLNRCSTPEFLDVAACLRAAAGDIETVVYFTCHCRCLTLFLKFCLRAAAPPFLSRSVCLALQQAVRAPLEVPALKAVVFRRYRIFSACDDAVNLGGNRFGTG